MNYYRITNSTDSKEVGHYIQCKGMISGKRADWFDEPNSMTKLSNDFYPEVEPDLRFELEERAKKTDLISTSNISAKGLLVSERLLSFLRMYTLANDHKIFEANVNYDANDYTYYWIHFVKSNLLGVDLENSKLYLSEFGFDKGDYISIKNYDQAISIMQDQDSFIRFEDFVLEEENMLGDLFYLPVPNQIFCSEKLYNEIRSKGFTGIEFEEVK